MSVLVRFAPPSLTAEQYDTVVAKLDAAGISLGEPEIVEVHNIIKR